MNKNKAFKRTGNTSKSSSKKDSNGWRTIKISKPIEHELTLLTTSKKCILGDIIIRVENDEYLLHRAMLASKSKHVNYFKEITKLSDVRLENRLHKGIVSLKVLDSDTFSIIVDIIYGKDLEFVLNANNFVSLLKAMHYLGMKIDLEIFKKFLEETIVPNEHFNNDMFVLYDYVLSCRDLFFLLPTVSQYFSDRLLEASKMKEFSSISYEKIIRILRHEEYQYEKTGSMIRICAEWICHNFPNRVSYLIDLVNMIKFRFGSYVYCAYDKDLIVKTLNKSSLEERMENIENYFNKLISYDGEISLEFPSLNDDLTNESEIRVINPFDEQAKWSFFLDKELYSDVTINVQDSTFKLHRVKLIRASKYFYRRFVNDLSKPEMNEYSLDCIDPEVFRSIIQYIYKGEMKVTSLILLVRLLKASNFLGMDHLFEQCNSKIQKNRDKITNEIFELFDFVCKNMKYSKLYINTIERFEYLWPKFYSYNEFNSISLDVLKEILAIEGLKITKPDDILDMCAEWIFHDIENRYIYTVQVANAINRNFMMDCDQFKLEIPSDSTDYTKDLIKNQLTRILSSSSLVSLVYNHESKNNDQLPRFIAMKTDKASLSILNANFDEIFAIELHILRGQSAETERHIGQLKSTLVEEKLFIIYDINQDGRVKFCFQVFDTSSKKLISLAVDPRMNAPRPYSIFNCNGEICFWTECELLKYSVQLNRWTCVRDFTERSFSNYIYISGTSDGKRLYEAYCCFDAPGIKVAYYDFEQNTWNNLPDLPSIPRYQAEEILKINIINNELTVLFGPSTFSFNWTSQKWNQVKNLHPDFDEFAEHEQNIIYIWGEKVYHYSPVRHEWTLKRQLPTNLSNISTIHTVNRFIK